LAISANDAEMTAVVRVASTNHIYHVRQGQFLDTVQVASIESRSVTLNYNGESFEVRLFQGGPQSGTSADAPVADNPNPDGNTEQ
jgi:CYTH domain-containing protein